MHIRNESGAVFQRPLTVNLCEGYEHMESGCRLSWMETQKIQRGPEATNDLGSGPQVLG